MVVETNKRLYVGGLNENVTTEALSKKFEKFGVVGQVDIHKKKNITGELFLKSFSLIVVVLVVDAVVVTVGAVIGVKVLVLVVVVVVSEILLLYQFIVKII